MLLSMPRHPATVRALSFHATYACRHSGACCSAGWIEPLADGRCRHYDGRPSGGCTIQRAGGGTALPHACQQFPRVATLSPLGASVTLSAFCPTAAALLFDDGPFTIEPLDDPRLYEGLDARDVMPPLLRPGMLMDWAAVARWEELAVATLSNHRHDVESAIGIIEDASLDVCERWTPGQGTLSDALQAAYRARASGASGATAFTDRRRDRSLARPQSDGAEDVPNARARAAACARFMASHAFACWAMYDGGGIRGAIDWLVKVRTALDDERRAHDLLDAFRRSDLRLRHTVTSPP